MKRILCWLLVATLPFGSVLADEPKSKNAKVTLVYEHELPSAADFTTIALRDGQQTSAHEFALSVADAARPNASHNSRFAESALPRPRRDRPESAQERTSSERDESGLSSQCRRPVQRLCHNLAANEPSSSPWHRRGTVWVRS
jgi:hypothetical protein